jgi:hypothetical protein
MARQSQPAAGALEASVRENQLRYEVVRELAGAPGDRRTSAVEVWVWATLPPGAAASPESPRCREAVRAATRVAAAAMASGGQVREAELEPFRHGLYESRLAPGRDEIYVAVRLRVRYGADPVADPEPDRRLETLRRRLEVMGVFEGRWRPRVPPPAAEPEPWSVRPAAGALAPTSPPSSPAASPPVIG